MPLSAVPAQRPEESDASSSGVPPVALYARGLQALVVEDNADTAAILAMLLRSRGISALTARSGAEAIELARRHPVQLVLLDIGLPDMKGWRVAHELRRMPHAQDLHIIAVTGNNAPYDRLCSMVSGVDEHLAKPVSIEALEAAFDQWRARRQHVQCG